jgi:hypothetical protein
MHARVLSFLGRDKNLKDNIPRWHNKQQEKQPRQQEEKEKLSPFAKRILVVDDNPDATFTFKKMFEEANRIGGNKTSFHANTYNDPVH